MKNKYVHLITIAVPGGVGTGVADVITTIGPTSTAMEIVDFRDKLVLVASFPVPATDAGLVCQ